jgi:predicted ATP-binding protein involved in virulence
MGTQSLPTDRKPFYKFTEKNGSIPILIYYKTEKFSSTPKDETSPEVGIPFQFYAYKNSLNSKLNQFQDFKEWFKQVEDEEVRQIRNRNNFNYRDQRLESIRNALDSFLSLLTDDVYKNLSVKMNDSPVFKFKPSGHTLAINKNGQDFSINQLSDGEKTLIMLVCDIARRLTIANPALENKLEGEGVVMIDEIELHLHPAWQRNVLPALQQTFPNIQFIVTTHSPQVLGGIERESLFILKDFQLQEYTPHTKGRDSNSILKEVQGVDERLPAYREKLDKLAKLLDDENVNEAGKLLVELKKDLGERDVEIAKIETIMHFFDD